MTIQNELNDCYARFDCHDFGSEKERIVNELLNANEMYNDVIIDEFDVLKAMKSVNSTKASGPDNISPKVIKVCADQLCGIFSFIFNLSLSDCQIPEQWKTSCIIPVPKRPNVKVMNDYRPIALTSCIMKIFERVFIAQLQRITLPFVDPSQFAYRKNRSVDDALLYVLNSVYSHLEKTNSSIRIMFYDFSSAFNTIQPHLLAKKLMNMKVSPYTILWIFDYLSNRPQFVKINEFLSNTVFTNTGCPQGTVLSPYLFSLYTSDSRESHELCTLTKYADDTALTGMIFNDDHSFFIEAVNRFVEWCDLNYLELNVSKTKEMVIDFRKTKTAPDPVILKGSQVERVSSYKYLGATLDDTLS